MPSETTTACVSLLVFFRIRRGTFPYGVEDDASTTSQTPTTYYASTCVKLTIVTHLSFSERIAIANLSLCKTKKQLVFKVILWRVHSRIYESGSYVARWYPNRSPRMPAIICFFNLFNDRGAHFLTVDIWEQPLSVGP